MRPHTTSSSITSLPSSLLSFSALSALLVLFPSPSTASFDCQDIVAEGVHFNLGKLGGPYKVHYLQEPDYNLGYQSNYTFTLDICNALKWHKGGTIATECHQGARVCGIREDTSLDKENSTSIHPIDIAGTYKSYNGRTIDPRFGLLRTSESNSDAGREGLRAELHGGRYPFDSKKGLDQRAIIEFVCDKDRSGLEGDEKDEGETEDPKDDGKGGKKDGDKDDKEKGGKGDKLSRRDRTQCEDSDKSLRFCGYAEEELKKGKKVKTLRLVWRTKYACEDAPEDSSGSHWGFFTWFIIIFFMATAAYLIFGSWLNYNRYGARGWDLLPHGDTIRDIPYIFKDWARRVKDTLQGPGSRGGYSAV